MTALKPLALKPLNREAVSQAIEKAERYRLLNEPKLAESICLDILRIEPNNPKVLVILLLSLSDQFSSSYASAEARALEVLQRLEKGYERSYYEGIIWERKAHAKLEQNGPHAASIAYELFSKAMQCFEAAESIRPAKNDDALLRWNTCVRMIQEQHLEPLVEEGREPELE